ncbi:hypothetical protein [Phascolarctobacterium succinatutens]|uniref:hypothetical protein n=1 Tax=Phascolarctobacterium succinatutens TaxID=626940 RepID=UPI0030806A9B
MVKTAKFTVYEKFFQKQRRKYQSKRSSQNSFKSIAKLKPSDKLCKLPKVKQDAQAYASASHPVIDYNKNIRN